MWMQYICASQYVWINISEIKEEKNTEHDSDQYLLFWILCMGLYRLPFSKNNQQIVFLFILYTADSIEDAYIKTTIDQVQDNELASSFLF